MSSKLDIKQLDARQWTQVKAALTLWATVLRNSRTHPATHTNIAPFFDDVAPLEIEELEALIDGLDQPPYMTRLQYAKERGISPQLASRRISGTGIKPIAPQGTHLYRTEDLKKVTEQYG